MKVESYRGTPREGRVSPSQVLSWINEEETEKIEQDGETERERALVCGDSSPFETLEWEYWEGREGNGNRWGRWININAFVDRFFFFLISVIYAVYISEKKKRCKNQIEII